MPKHSVIGVDLGGTKLLAGCVDPDGNAVGKAYRYVTGLGIEQLLDVLVEAISEVRQTAEAAGQQINRVGFGIPALMDRRTGRAVSSVHLPLAGVPFAELMTARLRLPVAVDNDGNCAALAEARLGVGKGASTLVFLGLGTGISSGVVIDGRLFRGSLGAATELGHMVVDLDGLPCQGNCPSRGCLETVASGTALERHAKLMATASPDSSIGKRLSARLDISGTAITEMALAGDADAIELFERMGRDFGVGLANVVNIFNPDIIAVGGGVIAAGELLLAPARLEMLARALKPGSEYVRVEQASFGSDSGMIGAALLAYEEVANESR